jgi:hypothetical protein
MIIKRQLKSSSLWFYRWIVVEALLLFVVGPVKPEAATAAVELLMMGMRTPETC